MKPLYSRSEQKFSLDAYPKESQTQEHTFEKHNVGKCLGAEVDIRNQYYKSNLGKVTSHLTQVFTARQCFQDYLYRIRKTSTQSYTTCNAGAYDDVINLLKQYFLLGQRVKVRTKLGRLIKVHALLNYMPLG